jgi:hypothetical protein
LFITTDNGAKWTELGNDQNEPKNMCAVRSAFDPRTLVPVFYVQVGACSDGLDRDQLWTFRGTNPSARWTQVQFPDQTEGSGISLFAVDHADARRLYAALLTPGKDPRMISSTDGGLTWRFDTELDDLMTEGGVFKYQTQSGPQNGGHPLFFSAYAQPSLLAFDPTDPDLIVAGGHDSGVFMSRDAGGHWMDGAVFGRAALWPSTINERPGALTVGGLRVTGISHILGVVSGDATTAARDLGSMQVPAEALSKWAAEQATLIKTSEISEDRQALCAEICLECGASVFGLPIARWGGIWLNPDQLGVQLYQMNEIALFVGDVEYEDNEDVPKWAFEQEFEFSDDILFIPDLYEPIGAPEQRSWLEPPVHRQSYLKQLVLYIIRQVWGGYERGIDSERVIGEVRLEEIVRTVDV